MSSADRSPFHTRYMKAHLTDELRSQVRVLKKFLKAQGLYGAEIRVRGFSGYACEVLTLKYGSFVALMKGATSWAAGSPISVEGGEEQAKSLFGGQAFVLLDPVDVTRNLGLAVSPTKLGEFVCLARAFLEKPDVGYFRAPKLKVLRYVPAYAKDQTLLLSFRYELKSEDILWGELWKSAAGIVIHLEKEGLTVLRHAVVADGGRAAVAFLLSPSSMPEARRRDGPEIFREDATRRFLRASERHGDSWWVGDDLRTHVLMKGRVSGSADILGGFMEDPVRSVGFARGLSELAKKSCKIRSGARAFDAGQKVEVQALAELGGFRF